MTACLWCYDTIVTQSVAVCGLEVCTVMGMAGIPRGNHSNGTTFIIPTVFRPHGNTMGTGSCLTGVTMGMESNADGDTTVKWKRD